MLIPGDAQAHAVDHGRVAAHDLLVRLLRAGLYEVLEQLFGALPREELAFPQSQPSLRKTTLRVERFTHGKMATRPRTTGANAPPPILDPIRGVRCRSQWLRNGGNFARN